MVWIVSIAIVVVIGGLWATFTARRLDAIQTNVQKSRFVLEHALNARSRASIDIAKSGMLDAAGSVLLMDIAREANDASIYPVIDDGLNAITVTDDAGNVVTFTDSHDYPDRLALESELSRTLRLVVDEMDDDERDSEQLKRLQSSRDAVRLTRRFHNMHVASAQRVRNGRLARLLRLHGNSALPHPVDLDDE